MTHSIMTLRIIGLPLTLRIMIISLIALSVMCHIMLSFSFSVVMLIVIILSVVMLSVVAPFFSLDYIPDVFFSKRACTIKLFTVVIGTR
jgi:hypothetical protein